MTRYVIHNHLPAQRTADNDLFQVRVHLSSGETRKGDIRAANAREAIIAFKKTLPEKEQRKVSGAAAGPASSSNDAKFAQGQSVKVTKSGSRFNGKTGKVAHVDSQGTVYVDFSDPDGGSGTFNESELS